MDNTDLIKTVRGLDQDGVGANGENLQSIWRLLVATPYNSFHAAEESTLRWLLKSMNGSSEAAEKLRRYPLTWSILDCVFQRIPLFSLAKSLADRKFLSVLQQTLKDVVKPVDEYAENSSSTKRKRSNSTNFSVDCLRSQQGCLETAQSLFASLKRLLDRLDNAPEGFSRDKLGAEHIRSLFCTSAADATSIATPALRICQNLLSNDSSDQLADCEHWVQVITTIWDLHLQGTDDLWHVAEYLFEPAAVILAKLGAFESSVPRYIGDNLKQKIWLSDVQHFMYRNLAIPGRAAFVNHRNLDAFKTAVSSCRNTKDVAAPALYYIASGAYQNMVEGGRRKDNVEWIKLVFEVTEEAVRGQPNRNLLMRSILEQSLERSSPVSVVHLRRICQEYALKEDSTEWSLLAKIAQCDTDVFQLSQQGIELRKGICQRILTQDQDTENGTAIVKVIEAMRDGFRTRRDLPGFLQLWFEQLCETENRKLHENSPWFTVVQTWWSYRNSPQDTLETELSPQRLGEILAWVRENSSASNPQAISAFAATIAQSIHSEQFADAIGRQLFDMVDGIKASPPFCALRWRVVSTTASWLPSNERGDIWAGVKKRLTKTGDKPPLLTAESYEAFKCCSRFWDIFSPDDAHVEEAAKIMETWIQRLATEMTSVSVLEGSKMTSSVDIGVDAEFDEDIGYQQYLSWLLQGSSRLAKLYFSRRQKLLPALTSALASRKASTAGVATLWNALISNDVNLNDSGLTKSLTDQLITSLDESQKKKDWPGETGKMWMNALSTLPLDSLDRPRREKLMTSLAKGQSLMAKSTADADLAGWKIFLGLGAKIMKRPTFYDSLHFSDLVECSEALSGASVSSQGDHEFVLELIERFTVMGTAVLKQMADHVDERSLKYFREASHFVSTCEKQADGAKSNSFGLPAFHLTLLKCLATQLSRSTNAKSNAELVTLLEKTQQATSQCVARVLILCASQKKLLDGNDVQLDALILTATDAAPAAPEPFGHKDLASSPVCKMEKRCKKAMQDGDLRAWRLNTFLQRDPSKAVQVAPITSFDDLSKVPRGLREPLMMELVDAATKRMDASSKMAYLMALVDNFKKECGTDGQLLAIEHVADQILASSDFLMQTQDGFSLATLHSELASSLLKQHPHTRIICRILRTLLEKRPQCMKQWNIEITLNLACELACLENPSEHVPSFSWLCRLVEVVIKKHRIRLEGHFHLVLGTMQILLQSLITRQPSSSKTSKGTTAQEAHAHLYARLVTLICEPTAGAVSRSQLHSSLDSATDAAKRSAGRHMYLVLVQYVKLQLESNVPLQVREALEPAMNSIFDITTPEGRKILNDAMDASGRAILKEMFKRYVKFGKWSGV